MPGELRSNKEDRLIDISKSWDRAIAQKNLGRIEQLLDSNVVLHADKITLLDDLHGRGNVLNYMKAYFERYDYERVPCTGAVDEIDNATFSLSVDKGVVPKKGVHDEQKKNNQVQPSHVITLTHLQLTPSFDIAHIFIGRQLSYDEAHRKLKKVPDYHGSSFNPETKPNDSIKPSADRARRIEHAASLWNKMFTDNDEHKSEEICDPNVKVHNLLTSDETKGLKEWTKNLAHIFKGWECKGNNHRIAVTPGNKAFIWWETSGMYQDQYTTVWGITFLVFNEDVKIVEAASIYQPFPGMREALLKAS